LSLLACNTRVEDIASHSTIFTASRHEASGRNHSESAFLLTVVMTNPVEVGIVVPRRGEMSWWFRRCLEVESFGRLISGVRMVCLLEVGVSRELRRRILEARAVMIDWSVDVGTYNGCYMVIR